jgi:hypothetical protein
MAVCQNLAPLVNIKIAGKWMFIPLKMVLIGIDPYSHRSGKKTNLFFWENLQLNGGFSPASFCTVTLGIPGLEVWSTSRLVITMFHGW